ncbi:MAG: ABC transporter ATP-binding protein [Oscillospiraceae bacterium]|nr:ABC transporter ATP-binding protein [Oscillospiraceae bacterium]MCL2227479.1 ABC transporter ATP-binding protein [Oscillospiraceae bacterium]
MISLSNIKVCFGDFVALHDISMTVEKGEFFTLLGPSGCGKTTTLRTITGFIKPEIGSVKVGDEEITHLEVEKRNIGMVFQNYALFPTMSVYENIAFGLKVKKMGKAEIKSKVDEIASKVELDQDQLGKKISQLSGGQQQRVAIARALVTSPPIICLDEPLSNLDAKLRVQLRNELKELQRKFGITTIYVTHDQEEALTLSDRIAVFNKGKIEQIGRPDEVYNQSASEFVCNFIGDINKLSKDFLDKAGAGQRGIDTNKSCYIRLERMYVNNHQENHIDSEAVVENFEYYGLYIKYTINAGGTQLKVIEKNSGASMYKMGESIKISFDPASVMQF